MRELTGVLATTLLVLGMGMGTVSGSASASPSDRADSDCVVIDTDFDFDDLMAIPPVLANRDVRAIVTTEGVSRPGPAAGAIRILLKRGGITDGPSVIVGAPSVSPHGPEDHPWMARLRVAMHRLNHWLPSPRPASARQVQMGRSGEFTERLVRSLEGCSKVDLLVIGPFTSFNAYAPLLADRIDEVVMQGKPLRGDPTADPDDLTFNCEYDMPSCEEAFARLQAMRATWVDVTRGVDPPYVPSIGMVRALEDAGMAEALERALRADQTTWRPDRLPVGSKSLLWDQLTALYLLSPGDFVRVGGHMETTLTPAEVRQAWVDAING